MGKNYFENIDIYKLLETLPNTEYDAITELASILCGIPLASISFITDTHQFYKSCYGCSSIPDPIDQSLSMHTFKQSNPIFIIEDTRLDDRFNDKLYVVNDSKIVFYAGIQLITSSKVIIGVLAVYDYSPKTLSDVQIKSLQLLANQVVQLIELHKSKIELDLSEKKYKAMIENSIIPILFSNPINGQVIDANKAACELFEYSADEFRTLAREKFIVHGSSANQILQKRRDDGITSIELIGIKKSGEQFPFEGSSSIFKHSDGELRSISILTDITKRKKIEQENLMLMNNTEVLFIMINSEFEIISFNEQFHKMYYDYFGVDIKIGGSFFDYAHPADRELEREICNRVMNGSYEENEFALYINGTKNYFLLKYHPTKDRYNIINGVFVTAFDITKRKNAERKLVKREQELSLIYNNVNDVIFLIENEGNNKFKIAAINKAYYKISGLKEEEVINHYLNEVIPEPSLRLTLLNYQLSISTKSTVTWEDVRTYSTGIKTIITTVTPILNSKGICTKLIGSIRDVTETRNVISENNKISNELSKIMFSSVDIICTIDEFGNFINVSNASEKIWGYLPEEIIGKPFINLVFEEDRERTLSAADELMNGAEYTYFENRYIKKDGTIVPIVWSIRWDEKDRIIYCTAKDATSQKKHEEELILSEKKYKHLFENNPAPMYVFDFETLNIVDCNDEVLLKYGYTREEFLQLNMMQIRPIEEIASVKYIIDNADKKGDKVVKFTTKHQKKSGEIIVVNINAHVMDYNGRKCTLVLIDDVTEKLNYLQSIERQNEILKEIAWMQSHVVRAPLARIMGFIELINDASIIEEKSELLPYILEAAKELDVVIKDIVTKSVLLDR